MAADVPVIVRDDTFVFVSLSSPASAETQLALCWSTGLPLELQLRSCGIVISSIPLVAAARRTNL
jgi:hypothetical protein